MLEVDLNRLRGSRTVRLEEDVPLGAALFEGTDLSLRRPLHASLTARQAGPDVIVQGEITGTVGAECRRCLRELELELAEPLSALFSPTLDPKDAGADEVYPLDPDARTLDLSDWVRESALLAAPRFAVCSETCRGLCPQCGRDLNTGDCDCEVEVVDERWGPLRELGEQD